MNYPFIISNGLEDCILETVEGSNEFMYKFTKYLLDGVAESVKKIVLEDPAYLKELKDMEFAISDYIQTELLKRILTEDWLRRGDKVGLLDIKTK